MNDNDILEVKAALEYVEDEPVTFECTTVGQDTEIEHAQIKAFIAGVEYAKNNS